MILLLMLLFSFFGVTNGIETEVIDVNLNEQNFVVFSCEASELDIILWYNSTEELGFMDRVLFPTHSSINITELSSSDAGIYKCYDPFGQAYLKRFDLKVTYSAKKVVEPIEWKLVPRGTLHYQNRQPIILPCRTTNKLDVVIAYRLDKNGKKTKLRQSGVVLHRPKASDSSTYQCIATRGDQFDARTFEIVVRVNGGISPWQEWDRCDAECGYGKQTRSRTCTNPPPANGGRGCYEKRVEIRSCRVRSCSSPKLVKFGYDMSDGDLKLYCAAKGIPTPTAKWKYRGRYLPSGFINAKNETVLPSSKKRSGSYSCTIKNIVGFFTMYITINV